MVLATRPDQDPRFNGVVGLNSFVNNDSASRLAMYCSHIGQAQVPVGATIKRQFTGSEREYGKNIHDIRMPVDGIIIKQIRKYPRLEGVAQIGDNPLTTVIYEDAYTRQIGMISLERHHCIHQYFGFNYVFTDVVHRLKPGQSIAKGEIIATSPAITSAGDYKFGLEAQVALASLPCVAEDGVGVSRSFLSRMASKAYGVRTASWGKNGFPINAHGKNGEYKIFPDIGEVVGPDGLLFATREIDATRAVTSLSRKALSRLDFFDKAVYAVPNAKVVDIIIYKGNRDKSQMPLGVDDQCQRYYRRSLTYYTSILAEYNRLRRESGDRLTITPEFERLVVEAIAVTSNNATGRRVTPTYNRQPMDEWMVQIVFEYDVIPTIGFKITGMHGDKGVIVKIFEDEDMPVDASGNRAEIIMDSDSTIKRMNIGRLHEIYINASGRATTERLAKMLGRRTRAEVDAAWEYLLDFYRTISPPMYDMVLAAGRDPLTHMEHVVRDGMYIYIPTNNPVNYINVIDELHRRFPACYGPVQYRGDSGRRVTTKSNILIGGLYILVLEKIGNTWASVASSKLQHFGIPAKLTNADKFSAPTRANPVRILGESEVRLIAAVAGGDVVAELLDQTNNPTAHKYIVDTILHAEVPTDIEHVIDREVIPRGQGRILTLVNHILECGGIRFTSGEQRDSI